MNRQLAIMSEVSFGMRDMAKPAFWFDVSFGEELIGGALIVINTERFAQMVEDADIHDIKNLKGAPCQVDVEGGIVTFVKILKR